MSNEFKISKEKINELRQVVFEYLRTYTSDAEVASNILTQLSTENLVKQSSRLTFLTWGLIIFAIAQIVVVILVGTGCISK